MAGTPFPGAGTRQRLDSPPWRAQNGARFARAMRGKCARNARGMRGPEHIRSSRITCRASRSTHRASRIAHHASCFAHHELRIGHASRVAHHALRIIVAHHASRIPHYASRNVRSRTHHDETGNAPNPRVHDVVCASRTPRFVMQATVRQRAGTPNASRVQGKEHPLQCRRTKFSRGR